jgi:hypothetical protein
VGTARSAEDEAGSAAQLRRAGVSLALAALLLPGGAPARAADCDAASDGEIVTALAAIECGADPCGETAAVREVVQQFRRCALRGVRICADRDSERNFIERAAVDERGTPTTIIWNPGLRSELEWGCDGDPHKAVRRDPTASLLHELVHAVQDCAGLDPADHEFEAVQIENIYRRAHKLCQRTRYGSERLPAEMQVACEPTDCRCASAGRVLAADSSPPAPAPARNSSAGDTAH